MIRVRVRVRYIAEDAGCLGPGLGLGVLLKAWAGATKGEAGGSVRGRLRG